MFNWVQAFSKVLAIVNAIKNDPALWAAIQALLNLFPTNPATGGGSPQMMQAALPDEHMEALKTAFDGASGVHAVMHVNEDGNANVEAMNAGSLFGTFIQFLPQIIALFNSLKH